MASFIATGTTADDYWLVNGSKDFSILPAGTLPSWTIDLPIRLHVGVQESYGQLHMEKHLNQFHDRLKRSIPELIYVKLGQGASIFDTDKPVKKKFQFGTIFQAFLFVERRYKDLDDGTRDEYLSMVSFYPPKRYQMQDTKDAIARYDSGNVRIAVAKTQAIAAAATAAAVVTATAAAGTAMATSATIIASSLTSTSSATTATPPTTPPAPAKL